MSHDHRPSRRSILATSLGIAFLSGCLGDDDSDEETEDDDSGRQGPVVGEVELSSAFPIELFEAETGSMVANFHYHEDGGSHWHRSPLTVNAGEDRTLEVVLYDANDEETAFDEEATLGLEIVIEAEEQAPATVDVTPPNATIAGREPGTGELLITVIHEPEESTWELPPLEIEVEPADS